MPDRSTELVQGPPRLTDTDAQTGRGLASILLEAGMNGDLDAWQEGLDVACGAQLSGAERERLAVVGGPPPIALENVLRRLCTNLRPHGHVSRLRLLAERYRLALDGDRDLLRWVEAALGHPPESLGRAGLLGPHGLPLRVQDLGAGLEPGPLPADWLGRLGPHALAGVCCTPVEPQPVWVLLHEVGEDPPEG